MSFSERALNHKIKVTTLFPIARVKQQLFNPKAGLSGLLPFKSGKLFILTLLVSFLLLPRLRPRSILF